MGPSGGVTVDSRVLLSTYNAAPWQKENHNHRSFEMHNEFRILLNRASIIIAIDTIRKCSAFTSIWPYLSDEISTENLQTKVQTYQPYNINCDQLQMRPDQINSRPGGLVNCVTFWSMNQQMNQSICSNRVKLMSTLATCNCFVWLWRGNQSMQSFTLNQANHY